MKAKTIYKIFRHPYENNYKRMHHKPMLRAKHCRYFPNKKQREHIINSFLGKE